MGKTVNVEIDLDEVLGSLDAEDVLDAFEDDEAMLKELTSRMDVSDFLKELDNDEVATNLDYDGLSVLCLREVSERIADCLSADEVIGFCQSMLKQACDNDADVEERLAEIAKAATR